MSRVAALAVTQTIGYGTLYYSFAVLLRPVAADLHAGTGAVTGAFTVSVVTGAVLAIPVGRLLDRHGGRALMTAGSLVGALALVAYSGVDRLWQLYAVQAAIGAASAASLYEAAFAVVLAWYAAGRRAGALLTLTVVAGFASTIFLPLTGRLVDAYGWRTAVLVLAAIQAVTVPLHAVFVRRPSPPAATRARGPVVWTALADRGFWLLVLAFTAHTAAVGTVTVHLVSALVAWGHPPAWAAGIAGLLGVLSVAGRLVSTGLQRRFTTTGVTAAVFAVQAVAALALPVAGATTAGAVGAVTGFGIGFGVATIARPVLLAERYDTARYATLAGILVVPVTLAKAVAPLAAASLHSYAGIMIGVAACCGVAAAALIAAGRVVPPVAARCHAGAGGSDETPDLRPDLRAGQRADGPGRGR